MSYKRFILSLLTMTSIGLAVRASSQQATSATPPAIDRDTMAVLDKMGTYLRTLQAFQIRSTTTTEDVLDDGQKIQTDGRSICSSASPIAFASRSSLTPSTGCSSTMERPLRFLPGS
jgi:hypothetical protein